MTALASISVRPVVPEDRAEWQRLWVAYLTFYETSLPSALTDLLWSRILDPAEPVEARVAVVEGGIVGIVHYFPHPDTWEENAVCYLQDLFVDPSTRGKGVGEALIRAVQRRARQEGWANVYWQTAEDNPRARRLYDKLTGGPSGFVVYQLEG